MRIKRYIRLAATLLLLPMISLTSGAPRPATHPLASVGRIGGGGPSLAVAVQGSYAYVGMGPVFLVLDLADPIHPREIGSLQFTYRITDIAVDGGYAYVREGSNLHIVAIYNPAAPVVVGVFPPISATNMAVAGGYAYITWRQCDLDECYSGGLNVFDVRNPAAPKSVGNHVYLETLNSITVAGGYAYLAGSDLKVLDLRDPANPVEVGHYHFSSIARDVFVDGRYAYVAQGAGGLGVMDVRDPAHPAAVGAYDTPGDARAVVVANGYAYLADHLSGLRIVDVRRPAAPAGVGVYDTPGTATALALFAGYAYVADGSSGLRIVNVHDWARPTAAGFYAIPGLFHEVAVDGGFAYATTEQGLWVIDVHNPLIPVAVGFYGVADDVRHVVAAGGYVYIIAYPIFPDPGGPLTRAVQVIDVHDPANPIQASVFPLQDRAWDIALAGRYIYLVESLGKPGLEIVDIANPHAPIQVAFLALSSLSSAKAVVVDGGYAYILDASSNGGVWIVNVTNPAAPLQVGFFSANRSFNEGLAVANGYAYILDRAGFLIVDLRNPSSSKQLGSYQAEWYPLSIAVLGEFAYIGANASGLQVFAVHQPASPVEISSDASINVSSVLLTGGYVFAIAGELSTRDTAWMYIMRQPDAVIAGLVTDASGLPVAGVTMTSDIGHGGSTGLTGTYRISQLPPGEYTVTPARLGLAFVPASQRVIAPGGANFVALPAPVSMMVTPGTPATLAYTDTQGLVTMLAVPTGAFAQPATLTLTPTLVASSGGLASAGHAFDLRAVSGGGSDLAFTTALSLTLRYSARDAWVIGDKRTLAVRRWDGAAWSDATTGCGAASHDTVSRVLRVPICQDGRYALFGSARQVYLPRLAHNSEVQND